MSQFDKVIESLQEGILLAVDKNLENASFDKTVRGRIVGLLPKNIYKVNIDGINYDIKSTSVHALGDTVNVLIPQNNLNNMLIIPYGVTPDMTLPANGGNADTVNYHTVNSDVPTDAYFPTLTDQLRLNGYIHDQILSSNIWNISHPLNKYPAVTVVDTGGNVVIGDINYISNNVIKITFSSEFSGKAYLS